MKFLVVLDALSIGGIGTAFRNYINYISDKVECDILIFNDIDFDKETIPKNVKILESCNALRILGMSQSRIGTYSKRLALARMILVGLSRITNGMVARRILLKFAPKLKGYDVAISYPQDVSWKSLARGCNHYVLANVDARIKAAYIHCDYSNFGGVSPSQINLYGKFDNIIGVSESCCNSFVSCFPSLAPKMFSCENFINTQYILDKSIAYQVERKSKLDIVTVCRISEEKGINRALSALAKLKEHTDDFHWHVVGGGTELPQIIELTQKMGLKENVTFVGEQENPYPYILNSDVFLLPSFHEAAPMVFGECLTLGVPVITTETCSAIELISDRKLGFVCDNSVEGIFNILFSCIKGELDFKSLDLSNRRSQVNYYSSKQFEQFLKISAK